MLTEGMKTNQRHRKHKHGNANVSWANFVLFSKQLSRKKDHLCGCLAGRYGIAKCVGAEDNHGRSRRLEQACEGNNGAS